MERKRDDLPIELHIIQSKVDLLSGSILYACNEYFSSGGNELRSLIYIHTKRFIFFRKADAVQICANCVLYFLFKHLHDNYIIA